MENELTMSADAAQQFLPGGLVIDLNHPWTEIRTGFVMGQVAALTVGFPPPAAPANPEPLDLVPIAQYQGRLASLAFADVEKFQAPANFDALNKVREAAMDILSRDISWGSSRRRARGRIE